MLSPREREYLKDIPAFEDKHGRAYAKVVRSRIRKKALIGLRDLWLIFCNNNADRRPLQELHKRKRFELMNEVKSGELSENKQREQAALRQVLGFSQTIQTKDGERIQFSVEGPLITCLLRWSTC